MAETIRILGVELKDFSLKDAAGIIEEYLNNDVLNTLCFVTKEMLLYAGENPEYRDCLESMDFHVVADRDVLKAAGIMDEERILKAENRSLWKLFLDTVIRDRRNCFLLAQTGESLLGLRRYLEEKFPDMVVTGTYVAEDAEGEPEVIVNEINGRLPDVILSALEQPFQEFFIHEQRAKLGAKAWFGLGPMDREGRFDEGNWLTRMIGKTVFHHRVQQYNRIEEEEGNA